MSLLPNQSLYVRNLNEKIQKEDLKRLLYEHFSRFGRVLDVVALKTIKMRGQAFVVFSDLLSATSALKTLHQTEFLGKSMNIQYAKSSSNVLKQYGMFKVMPNQTLPSSTQDKRPREEDITDGIENLDLAVKKQATESDEPPHHTLYVSNLPESIPDEELYKLFEQCSGLKDCRLIPSMPGHAFVEFETVNLASVALKVLNQFEIDHQHILSIKFAKQ